MNQTDQTQENILTIQEALYQNLAYRFKQAGMPVMSFNVFRYSNRDEYSVTALFGQDNFESISIDLQVNGEKIQLVAQSGTIKYSPSLNQEELFSMFASSIFKRIAKEVSLIKRRRNPNYEMNSLEKNNGDLISLENVTYADFEQIDISDIDFSQIYIK